MKKELDDMRNKKTWKIIIQKMRSLRINKGKEIKVGVQC
jgi:hypothetical protein